MLNDLENLKESGSGVRFDAEKVRFDLFPEKEMKDFLAFISWHDGTLASPFHKDGVDFVISGEVYDIDIITYQLLPEEDKETVENFILIKCRQALWDEDIMVRELARVYTFGAVTYGVDNWKRLENGEIRCLNSMVRHLLALSNGEFINKKDGNLMHAAQVIWNILSMRWFRNNKPEEIK